MDAMILDELSEPMPEEHKQNLVERGYEYPKEISSADRSPGRFPNCVEQIVADVGIGLSGH